MLSFHNRPSRIPKPYHLRDSKWTLVAMSRLQRLLTIEEEEVDGELLVKKPMKFMLSVSWHKWVGGELESSFCMAASAFWVITVCYVVLLIMSKKNDTMARFICMCNIAVSQRLQKNATVPIPCTLSYILVYTPDLGQFFKIPYMDLRHQPVRFSRVWRAMQWCMGQASARMKTGKWWFGRLVRKTFVKRRIWFETTTFLRKCFWNSCPLGKFCLKRITRPGEITHVRPESS